MDLTGIFNAVLGFFRFILSFQLVLQIIFLILATALIYQYFVFFRYEISFDAQAKYLHGDIDKDEFSRVMIPRFVVVRAVQLISIVAIFFTIVFNSSGWILAISLALFIGSESGQRTFLENLSDYQLRYVDFNLIGQVR